MRFIESLDPAERLSLAMRRSLPRPLIPLLLFLYSAAKYSHSSRSCGLTSPLSVIWEKRVVKERRVVAWNLFWCDYLVRCQSLNLERLAVIYILLKYGPGGKEESRSPYL